MPQSVSLVPRSSTNESLWSMAMIRSPNSAVFTWRASRLRICSPRFWNGVASWRISNKALAMWLTTHVWAVATAITATQQCWGARLALAMSATWTACSTLTANLLNWLPLMCAQRCRAATTTPTSSTAKPPAPRRSMQYVAFCRLPHFPTLAFTAPVRATKHSCCECAPTPCLKHRLTPT